MRSVQHYAWCLSKAKPLNCKIIWGISVVVHLWLNFLTVLCNYIYLQTWTHLRSSEMLRHVTWWVYNEILDECTASIFRVKLSTKNRMLTIKMQVLCYLEILVIILYLRLSIFNIFKHLKAEVLHRHTLLSFILSLLRQTFGFNARIKWQFVSGDNTLTYGAAVYFFCMEAKSC